MKKGITIVFALFYLLVCTGLTLDVHYCQGKVVDIEMLGEPDHCCSKIKKSCEKEDNSNCCNDETLLVQLDHWQIASSSSPLDFGPVRHQVIFKDYQIVTEDVSSDHHVFNDLPPPKAQPLWLLYQTFTFYG